jgi:hypothetical protein
MWINHGYFYTNSFLSNLGFRNFVTTKKAGNIKRNKLQNIAIGEQTHSDNFLEIKSVPEIVKNNDGFITGEKNLWLGVFTADCLPVFVVSGQPKMAAMLHSGRKGVELDITGKCVDYFVSLGAKMEDISVVIGPHISRDFYEQDLQAVLKDKLLKRGFLEENFYATNLCTVKNNDEFFSYRKENKTESRMLSGLAIS